MRIVSYLWGDREEEVEEDADCDFNNLLPSLSGDPSKYLKVNSKQHEFTPVLSESKKKKLRQKAKQVQKDAYNTRSKGGSLSLLI